MNDSAIKLTTAGWIFMLCTWAVVLTGAGLCIHRIMAVKGKQKSSDVQTKSD
ncbi:hypothetical protein LLG46_11005 [bacterium]|nr:hypothetical protein [bacterium]